MTAGDTGWQASSLLAEKMALMDAVQDALVEQRDLAATFRTLFGAAPSLPGKKPGKLRTHTRAHAPPTRTPGSAFAGYSSPLKERQPGLVGRVGAAARGLRESYSAMGGGGRGGVSGDSAGVRPGQVCFRRLGGC